MMRAFQAKGAAYAGMWAKPGLTKGQKQCNKNDKAKFKSKKKTLHLIHVTKVEQMNNAIPKRTLIIYFLYSFISMLYGRTHINPFNIELKICETAIR